VTPGQHACFTGYTNDQMSMTPCALAAELLQSVAAVAALNESKHLSANNMNQHSDRAIVYFFKPISPDKLT